MVYLSLFILSILPALSNFVAMNFEINLMDEWINYCNKYKKSKRNTYNRLNLVYRCDRLPELTSYMCTHSVFIKNPFVSPCVFCITPRKISELERKFETTYLRK